ncbi:Hypothetical protein HVR_LOCUS884 [uncultured virus]|nr:Hypothetical protein HVR_LOCUS884 [uncultured virus]
MTEVGETPILNLAEGVNLIRNFLMKYDNGGYVTRLTTDAEGYLYQLILPYAEAMRYADTVDSIVNWAREISSIILMM